MKYLIAPDRFIRQCIQRSDAWRIILLLGFHLLVSFVFIAFFSRWFTQSAAEARMLVIFHLLVNASLWLLLFGICGLLMKSLMRFRISALIALIPAAVFHFILLLYLADYITNQKWGINVSDRIAWEFIRRFTEFRGNLLSSASWIIGMTVLLLGMSLYVWLARRAMVACGDLLLAAWQQLSKRSVLIQCASAFGLLLFVAGYAVLMIAFWRSKVVELLLWRREPFVSFVVLSRPHLIPDNVRSVLFPVNARRLQNAAQDAQIRQLYPRTMKAKKNVVLMVVDCLRADHLSMYGYHRQTTPFLHRLYEQGRLTKFDDVRSVCNCTPCGVMSALASRDVNDLGKGLFALHDLLRDQGYKTNFILAGWHDVWYDLRELYGHSIDYYFEGTQSSQYLPDDDRLLLEGLSPVPPREQQPAFFYFHLMSAHDVGVYSPEYARWQPALSFTLGGSFASSGNDAEISANTYDNKLLKADAMIELVFAQLERKGYLQDSIVAIIGDHGQALGEHGSYGHGKFLYEEDLRIPLLLIDGPNVRYQNSSATLPLDLAPTILERLSLPVPSGWQGNSLLQANKPRPFTIHRGCLGGTAIVQRDGTKTWKYIQWDAPTKEELYELQSDPRETRNLVNEKEAAKVIARLRELMEKEK